MFSTWTKASLVGLLVAAPIAAAQELGTCNTLNQRRPWTALSDDEKTEFLDAMQCLVTSPAKPDETGIDGAVTRWDEVQYAHTSQANFIHAVGAFLPWHRLYVRTIEVLLQNECNYTGAFPWWDELTDAENILNGTYLYNESAIFDNTLGFGGDGDGEYGASGCVTVGPFANLTLRIEGSTAGTEYCLSRAFTSSTFTTAVTEANIDACLEEEDYDDAWQCFNEAPHIGGHMSVGGLMADVSLSPGDPLFFVHHAFLDKLWWDWQNENLTVRLTEISGVNIPDSSYLTLNGFETPSAAFTDYDGDDGNVTTLNHVLWMANIIPNATISEVMDLGSNISCAEYLTS